MPAGFRGREAASLAGAKREFSPATISIPQQRHRGIVEAGRADFFGLEDFVVRRLVFLLGRGEAYLVKGDLEHALTDADQAVSFAPSSLEARLLRARVHDKRGSTDLAAADRGAAAKLVPDPIVAAPMIRPSGTDKLR